MKGSFATCILSLLVGLLGCSHGSGDGGTKKARGKLEYPVQIAPLSHRQVRYSVMAPGSIEAFQQVQITARVPGAVDRVAFTEGREVKKGDVLVMIESERYSVAMRRATAALDKATAAARNAEANLERRRRAVSDHPGLIPGEEIAQ